MVYAIVQNIVGSVETQLQQFKIQEELNNNDLNLIVNILQDSMENIQFSFYPSTLFYLFSPEQYICPRGWRRWHGTRINFPIKPC